MKREITVMGVCAVALLVVEAYVPYNNWSKALVLIIEAGVFWALVSAFRKG
ncbi:MAG: hypothetical protein JSS86_04175 [Cyanobacteria bacterium SZAS LIN-2]|nr:hypothetical protein [Cyanobacteria bacterium SZAS LIN-2]